MRNSSSPAVDWGDDSAGEMDSENTAAAASMGMGVGIGSMMEVDADDRHPGPASSLPIDADFFNAFPDDFDDQDIS